MAWTPGSAYGAVTRQRIYIAASLILTWLVAYEARQWSPAAKAHISAAWEKVPSVKVDWEKDPRANYNASKVALIIEPEPIPLLVPLILHMIAVVPDDWRFLFIGSKKSVFSVRRSFGLQVQEGLGKLDFKVLPAPWNITTEEDRARTLTNPRFYDDFLPKAEWLLKYNSDSILCANSEVSVDDWLDWSWTGAARDDERFAGYGGLSLRRVSAIKQILGFQKRYNDTEPEDEWFGKRLIVLPGAKVANSSSGVFAVENKMQDAPMGFTAKGFGRDLDEEVWNNTATRKAAFEYCPELHIVMDMKLKKNNCEE